MTTSANFDQYVYLRNTYAIGNYGIRKKNKYMKRLNTKEYVLNHIDNQRDPTWVSFDDYWLCDLMNYKNFKYVDEYLKIIPLVCEKTSKLNRDYDLYYNVWKLGSNYIPGDRDFCHNGCFYLAMIFLGYEYKLLPKGYMGFYCKIKPDITSTLKTTKITSS
jgi:hypothetical protein